MSRLLDAQGNEVEVPKVCPRCASEKIAKAEMFGGYWQINCLKCGHQLAKGKE